MAVDGVEVSERFRACIEAKIQRLERDAARDELLISQLEHEDHIRRQRLLVRAQLDDAARLRSLLGSARLRPAGAASRA